MIVMRHDCDFSQLDITLKVEPSGTAPVKVSDKIKLVRGTRSNNLGISTTLVAIIVIIIVVVAGVAAYYVAVPYLYPQQTLTPVNVMIGAPVALAYYGFLWYGVDSGIYAKYGLDVTVLIGSGGPGNVAAVSAGKTDFSITDPGSVALGFANSNITNVKMVSAIFDNNFFVVLYNKAIIHTPKDLNGKTAGTFQGNAGNNYFKIFAKANGINVSSINFVYASGAVFNNLIILHKVDFLITTENQVADLALAAKQANISLGYWNYADYGVVDYGNGIITSTNLINSNPTVVQNFVKATWESLKAAQQNPQAAVESAMKVNPALNLTVGQNELLFMLNTFIPTLNSTSNLLTLGWINATKISQTIDTTAGAFGFTNLPAASDIYTNQFVQQS